MGILRRKKQRGGAKRSLFTAGIAAGTAYFFDPEMGRTRRAKVQDKFRKLVNRSSEKTQRAARRVGAEAYGVKQKVTHVGSEEPPENDQTLAAKVESEILARADFPKGKIAVNAEDGVVYLRGELEDEGRISELEQEVRKVTGVVDVMNLLHLPGEPPPNKEAALKASKPE